MILLSHPTGNQNVRHAGLAMAQAGLLTEFWTALSWDPDAFWARCVPTSLRQQLNRRGFPEGLRARVRQRPWREAGRLVAQRLGWAGLLRHEEGFFSIDAVYRSFDRAVARRVRGSSDLRAVYAYEDGAKHTFAAARERGLKTIYDLPIGYWRAGQRLYAEEAERHPEWSSTLSGTRDSAEKLERKEAELRSADTLIVASSFTRRTVEEAPQRPARTYVLPYGAPAPPAQEAEKAPAAKLRVLFAGGLSQRKGLSYLLEAVRMAGPAVELTLLGQKTSQTCTPLNEAVRQHRWIPSLPHAEVLALMEQHDVLVFPSLFEGFGLVMLEALSRGLPVITTPHTGGPDLLTEGEDGFIVPIRSAEAIARKLLLLAEDRPLLRQMAEAARAKARQFSWEAHHLQLIRALHEILNLSPSP